MSKRLLCLARAHHLIQGDGLEDRPVDMSRAVTAAEAENHTARRGIPMRVHHTRPVRLDQQTVGADRQGERLGFQVFEDIRVLAAVRHEVVDEPVDQKSPGAQTVLEDVALALRRDFGAPGRADAVFRRPDAGYHRGAQIDIGAVRPNAVGPQPRTLPVAARRVDRRTGLQSGFEFRFRGNPPQFGTGRRGIRQLLRRDLERLQELRRPAFGLHIEQAHGVGGGPAGPVGTAAKPLREITLHVDEMGGPGKDLGFVLFHPDQTVETGRDVDGTSGDAVDALRAEALGKACNLRPGTLVQPGDSRINRVALRIQKSNGFALIGNGDGVDPGRPHLRDTIAQRGHTAFPPVERILLKAIEPGIEKRDRRPPLGNGLTSGIPGDRLGALRRAVQPDNQSVGCLGHSVRIPDVSGSRPFPGSGRFAASDRRRGSCSRRDPRKCRHRSEPCCLCSF